MSFGCGGGQSSCWPVFWRTASLAAIPCSIIHLFDKEITLACAALYIDMFGMRGLCEQMLDHHATISSALFEAKSPPAASPYSKWKE